MSSCPKQLTACRSEKDLVDVAAGEYIEAHRDEINAAPGQLNGSDAAARLITGLGADELSDLGGLSE